MPIYIQAQLHEVELVKENTMLMKAFSYTLLGIIALTVMNGIVVLVSGVSDLIQEALGAAAGNI